MSLGLEEWVTPLPFPPPPRSPFSALSHHPHSPVGFYVFSFLSPRYRVLPGQNNMTPERQHAVQRFFGATLGQREHWERGPNAGFLASAFSAPAPSGNLVCVYKQLLCSSIFWAKSQNLFSVNHSCILLLTALLVKPCSCTS